MPAALHRLLEPVVLGDGAARRQRASLRGDSLDRPTDLDLGFEEPISRVAVLLGFTGEADVGIEWQGLSLKPEGLAHAEALIGSSVRVSDSRAVVVTDAVEV